MSNKNNLVYWFVAVLSLIGLLVFAYLIRIINLNILPVFADEAIYIRWSQIMAHEPTLRFLPLSDGKQPLYMWILMFIVDRLSDPLFAGRILSVFAGLGTLIGISTLSFILFRSRLAAFISGFLYSISPFTIFFDRMALVDSLLACFSIWTLVFGTLTAKYMRLDMALLTGFALGFAALTKSPALFVALLLPTTFIVSNFSKKPKLFAIHLIKFLMLIGVSFVLAIGLYNIQRLGPNFHMLTSRTKDYVFPISHLWENPEDPFIFHFDRAFEWIRMMGPSTLILLALVGMVIQTQENLRKVLLLLMWFIVPIVIQAEFAKVFTARYILYTLPPLFVLAGSTFVTKRSNLYRLGYVITAVFVFQSIVFNYNLLTNPENADLPRSERSGYLEEWTAGTGIMEVSEYLKNEANKNPNVHTVVGTEGFFGTLPDGLQMYVEKVPNLTVIGVGLGIAKVPSELEAAKKSGDKVYLAINSSRLNIDKGKTFEEVGLYPVLSYKKADRPEFVKEYVQYGQYDTFYLFEIR